MLRPRARVGHALVVRRRQGLASGLMLAVLLTLTGCGSSEPEKADDGPSKATVSCRAMWKDLEPQVEGPGSKTNPSALSSRWNTIAATIDYYATAAQSSDCGKTLETQVQAMDDLADFGTKLAPYDMELRLDDVRDDAEEYAAGPVPPAPEKTKEPSPKKKGKKKSKQPPAPPKPADVALALKTLTTQAPVATQQQLPGWQQAAVTDLADTTAVAKTVKDLAFLSSESAAYRACLLALAKIGKALEPVTTR